MNRSIPAIAAITAAAIAASLANASIGPSVNTGISYYNSPTLSGYTFQGFSHGRDDLPTSGPSLMTQNFPDLSNSVTFSMSITDIDPATRQVVFRWEADNDRIFSQLVTADGLTMTAIGWFIGDLANDQGYFQDSQFVELVSATSVLSGNGAVQGNFAFPITDGSFFNLRSDGFFFGTLYRTASTSTGAPTYQDVSELYGSHELTVTYTIPAPATLLALAGGLLFTARRRAAQI
ncbi:MAG: hypothetical protein LAT64_07800 [Phycisphaerales bacterium]|nr:hypothetical protein [Planctomycetota bacterium]MCH8508659.1 hypothetical protein [Phycisphaerales bacterium]